MNKKRLLIVAVIIAAVAGYFVWDNFLKTAPSMKRLDAEYQVKAVGFYAEFEEDEEAANARYLNKIVEIEGVVESVEVADGLPVISLKTDGFGLIKCTMETAPSEAELSEIQPNSAITIKGECIGMLLDVLIGRSIVVE